MKEKNKDTLSSALRQMPLYEPKDSLWDQIARELNWEERRIDTLQRALKNLPQHEPPKRVWRSIEKALKTPAQGRQRTFLLWSKVAAIGLLVLTAAFWVFRQNSNGLVESSQFTYNYSTEQVSNQLIQANWNEDEESFAEIEQLLKKLEPESLSEEIVQLKQELQELNLAKAELQQLAGNYNSNPRLITQLKKIELERTQIAKQLLRKII